MCCGFRAYYHTCVVFQGTNGKQWTVSLGTTDIDRRTDNITVVHYPCKKKGSSKTYLFSGDDTVMRPQTLTKGEVITLEYIRRKVTGSYIESDDWPPSTKFEMFIKSESDHHRMLLYIQICTGFFAEEIYIFAPRNLIGYNLTGIRIKEINTNIHHR